MPLKKALVGHDLVCTRDLGELRVRESVVVSLMGLIDDDKKTVMIKVERSSRVWNLIFMMEAYIL